MKYPRVSARGYFLKKAEKGVDKVGGGWYSNKAVRENGRLETRSHKNFSRT